MSIHNNDMQVITCLKCNSQINQFSIKKRTICPYCGNLFEEYKNKYIKEIKGIQISKISTFKLNIIDKKTYIKSRFSWFQKKCKSQESLVTNIKKPIIFSNKTLNFESITRPKKNESVVELQKEMTLESLNWFILNKQKENDFTGICENFSKFFITLQTSCFHFQNKNNNLEIQLEKLYRIYDCINEMSMEFQTDFMKTIKCTIQSFDILKYVKEEIFALTVILLNPLFDKEDFFTIFESCVNSILSIHNRKDQQIIIDIMRRLPIENFKLLLQRAQNFLSFCLYSKKNTILHKDKLLNRWIEKAVKFIVLLKAANDFNPVSQKLPTIAFYNCSINYENLIRDYRIWQNPHLNEFTFCQYPCVLSIFAKKQIIQKESEEQMINVAKDNLLLKMQQHQIPEFEMVFLNLSIRRSNIVFDSMNEILAKQRELKKKVKIRFVGEPGLDMGGLTKEWFLLLLRQILHAETSVFSYDPKSRYNWFHSVPLGHEHQEFYLTGVLMGLAVYNSINLDVKFPLLCYKKLLSPKVYTPRNKKIGICSVTLDDLSCIHPDLASGLKELIYYDGNIENDFCVTFEIIYEDWHGNKHNHLLKENGSNIYVTTDNRKEYVDLYCDFLLNTLIQTEFQEFYRGFHTVCDSNIFMLLQPEEIENLVCGNSIINLSDLKKVVEYDNYKSTDKTIILFWEVLLNFNESLQKLFLHFTTGSDRIPVGGIQELQFKISKSNNNNMLPVAYTCFNQLILPAYNDKNVLKLKLLIAMENSEGFGLT